MILQHLNKNYLHHAYLIEGAREEILPEVLEFIENMGTKTQGNPDFCRITIDNFKIEQAFDLRAMSEEMGFTAGRKIFVVCANTVSLDAQNVLLKMFEEPIQNTHFFVIVPDANSLLKTLTSRFYLISAGQNLVPELKDAEKFIRMQSRERSDFIKDLLYESDEKDEERNKIVVFDSARAKALNFLNALETVLHNNYFGNSSEFLRPSTGTFRVQNFHNNYFEHIFKVREFLRMPGSSAKNLLDSVALIIPNLKS